MAGQVQMLQNDTGANLGAALGAVGGYFATQKQRKEKQATAATDKATALARQTSQDALNARNIQANIDEKTQNIQHSKDTDAFKGVQRQALSDALVQVHQGPPPGTSGPALAAWAAKIKSDAMMHNLAPTSPESKALDEALTEVVNAKHAAFVQNEHALPSKPQDRLSTLMKRLDIERQQGIDTAPTMGLIKEVQGQMDRQATMDATKAQHDQMNAFAKQRLGNEDRRISISLQGLGDREARGARSASSSTGDPASFADVSGRLRKAKNRDEAQAILDSPEGGNLSDRQYTRLQKVVDETHGSYTGTHGSYGQQHPKPAAADARGADYDDGVKALAAHPDKRDEIVRRYAAKYHMKPDDADALFQ